MKRNIITKAWLLLFLLSGAMPTLAQSSGDGYNPTNPSDPGDPDKLLKYGIEAVANISGAGTVTGSGTYKYGTSVTVKTTTNTGYKFLYWTKDEAEDSYKTATSFTHTVECNVKFTAVFEKLKTITAQSNYTQITKPTVTGGASGYFSKGTTAKLTAATKADYQFKGWQRNGEEGLCSTQNPYTITVGDNDEVYTAVYDYLPGNPADPSDVAGNVFYNVKVSTNEPGWGIVAGTGKYKKGTQVSISTSPTAGYALQSWTKRTADGDVENFATTRSFTYTMDAEDVEFIAVYYNIAENLEANGHSVNLVASEPGTCTFSIANGQKYLEGDAFTVTVTTGTDVNFEGWYINGVKVADTKTYGSYMGAEDITLEAKCHYNPYNPADPNNDLGYEEEAPVKAIKGDVNGDGVTNVTDAVQIINSILGNKTDILSTEICDMNGDGVINVSDAIQIINEILKRK